MTLYSLATGAGTTNITPLTSLMVLNMAAGNIQTLMNGSAGILPSLTATDLSTQNTNVDTLLASVLPAVSMSATYNFLTGSFTVGSNGYDQLLDDLTVNLTTPAAITVVNNTVPGSPVTIDTASGRANGTLNFVGGPGVLPVGTLGTVSVPNVVGDTQAAATTAITGANLIVGTLTMQASSTVASGKVISESPAAGTSVSTSSDVNLTISTGSGSVSVPNVVDDTQAAATTAITGAGLTVGTVTQASSTTVPLGSVISESPAAGTSVSSGNAITLVVSSSFTTLSATLTTARAGHTATLLSNGLVLITGGCSAIPCSAALNTAELYDPVADSFTALTARMTTARAFHTAIVLPNGQVLLTGGWSAITGSNSTALNSAEVYDPASQTFTALSVTLKSARALHTATMLTNGRVLLTGGESDNSGNTILNTAEAYDPVANTFTTLTATMTSARTAHAASLLPNGQVLITGGDNASGTGLNTAEVYDPVANAFTPLSATMTAVRAGHTATLLPNGQILLAGGGQGATFATVIAAALKTAEVYDPVANSFTTLTATMTTARALQKATLLPDGQVLITGGAGGTAGNPVLNSAEVDEVLPPSVDTFAALTATMTSARVGHTATLLPQWPGALGRRMRGDSLHRSQHSGTVQPHNRCIHRSERRIDHRSRGCDRNAAAQR